MSTSQARLDPRLRHLRLAWDAVAADARQPRDEVVATDARVALEGMRARQPASHVRKARLLGLLVVSLGPALFWTCTLAIAGALLGAPVTGTALVCTLVGIAGFLVLVCSPFFLRS